jgi:hypothetical protein
MMVVERKKIKEENKRYCERSIEMYVMAERTKNGSR